MSMTISMAQTNKIESLQQYRKVTQEKYLENQTKMHYVDSVVFYNRLIELVLEKQNMEKLNASIDYDTTKTPIITFLDPFVGKQITVRKNSVKPILLNKHYDYKPWIGFINSNAPYATDGN